MHTKKHEKKNVIVLFFVFFRVFRGLLRGSYHVMRPPHIHHCTSEPYRFFGRAAELALLDAALAGCEPSVAALVGPGGQGKTAIVQHY